MARLHKWLLASAAIAATGAAIAAETISYSYDARGRVTKVVHSGGANNGVSTVYTYDKADNRTAKTTTGAGGQALQGAGEGSAAAPGPADATGAVAQDEPSGAGPGAQP